MKYLMLVCVERPVGEDTGDIGRPVGAAPEEIDVYAWVEEMDGRGVRLLGERIRPDSDSTTVRVRDGEVLLTDGPLCRDERPGGRLRRDRVRRPRRSGGDRVEAPDGAGRRA